MAKTVNYTPEMTATMVETYERAETDQDRKDAVAMLSERFGRSVASVRQKLVREGVYKKAAKVAKDGNPVVSKAALVAQIATAMEADVEDFDSLEKATKNVLQTIADFVSE